MDGGKRMTGNAGTEAITVSRAQPAHYLISWGHLGTQDWNVKGITHKMLCVLFQRERLALLFSSHSSVLTQTFII